VEAQFNFEELKVYQKSLNFIDEKTKNEFVMIALFYPK